jgi:nucleotide-binding universal stress UspA family protein
MRILVAYDGSISADAAIEDLGRAGLPEQAEALVICVADKGLVTPDRADHKETQPDPDESWRSKLAEAEVLAGKAGERIRSHFPQWTVSAEALLGSPAKIILETTTWWHPQLVVVGSHGRSAVARLFLGSVSMELIHKAPCSVRVTRMGGAPKADGPIRIVIGVDGSEEADMVSRSVAARSWPERTEAQIVSAVQTLVPVTDVLDASTFAQEPAYSVIRDADERLRFRLEGIAAESANALRRAGLIATTRVVDGDPREAILAAAEFVHADTIFVGARGMGRMQRLLLGSVSSYVVTHAHCTVEVVRGNHAQ